MSATVGLPSSVVIRDLVLTLWFNRWRIFLITLVTMAIATYVALQVQPKYQSNSSMLVLLGPDMLCVPWQVSSSRAPSMYSRTSCCIRNQIFLPALTCTAALLRRLA